MPGLGLGTYGRLGMFQATTNGFKGRKMAFVFP